MAKKTIEEQALEAILPPQMAEDSPDSRGEQQLLDELFTNGTSDERAQGSATAESAGDDIDHGLYEEDSSLFGTGGVDQEQKTKKAEGEAEEKGGAEGTKDETQIIRQHKISDQLGERFLIEMDRPLPQFDSHFAKAYNVRDKKNKDNNDLYCLVFERGAPIRNYTIVALKKYTHLNLSCPLDEGVTQLSSLNQKRFVAVLRKPSGRKLSEIVAKDGAIPEEMLVQSIIVPVTHLLKITEKLGVTHGRVHPNNIYINDDNKLVLGECISEPCGYSQPHYYEPPERAGCLPIGKGESTSSVDYYALGMVILYILLGKELAAAVDKDVLIEAKLTEGSFNTLVTSLDISVPMQDILRGLLNDNRETRWTSEQIEDWVRGKRFNLLVQSAYVEASRSIFFNDKQYINRKSLAHALHRNWDKAKKFLKEETVIKWLRNSVKDPETATIFERATRISSGVSQDRRPIENEDELVARSILILDPNGPIRYREFVAHVDALGPTLAYGYAHSNRDYLQIIGGMLSSMTLDGWSMRQESNKSNHSRQAAWAIRKCHTLVSKRGIGFGLERCLYELNPSLPCQSPIVVKNYPVTLLDVLSSLDDLDEKSRKIMDRHVAGFVAAKLELGNEIKLKNLVTFPMMARDEELHVLYLLSAAQKKANIRRLRGLSAKMASRLGIVVSKLHSKSIREEMNKKFKSYAKEGDLGMLYRIVADTGYLVRDNSGFIDAIEKYKKLSAQIAALSNKDGLEGIGFRYGLQLSVIISYLIAAVTMIIMLSKSV